MQNLIQLPCLPAQGNNTETGTPPIIAGQGTGITGVTLICQIFFFVNDRGGKCFFIRLKF